MPSMLLTTALPPLKVGVWSCYSYITAAAAWAHFLPVQVTKQQLQHPDAQLPQHATLQYSYTIAACILPT
jgi:hypothetical protein